MTSSSSLALRIDAGAGFTSALDSIIFTLYSSPALWLDPDYTPSGTIEIVCRACAPFDTHRCCMCAPSTRFCVDPSPAFRYPPHISY